MKHRRVNDVIAAFSAGIIPERVIPAGYSRRPNGSALSPATPGQRTGLRDGAGHPRAARSHPRLELRASPGAAAGTAAPRPGRRRPGLAALQRGGPAGPGPGPARTSYRALPA